MHLSVCFENVLGEHVVIRVFEKYRRRCDRGNLNSARILARILIIFDQREQKIKPKIFCARNLLEKKFL